MMQGTIESIAFGGSGVLKSDGYVVFVPFTAPGDQVHIELVQKKKHYGVGKLVELQSPSPLRTTPPCPYFGKCGGCQLQHLSYAAQLEVKRKFIEDALQRIGKIQVVVPPVEPAPLTFGYRRHITLQLRAKEDQGFEAGYIGADGHTFLPINTCPIFSEHDTAIFASLRPLLHQLSPKGIERATLRLFKAAASQYLLVLHTFPHLPQNAAIAKELLSAQPLWEGISFSSPREQVAYGQASCHVEILGIKATFALSGFLQNFPEQMEKIYRAILDNVPESAQRILDLYSGVGLTSLLLAQRKEAVVAVELHSESTRIAVQNAHASGIHNVEFLTGKAEQLAPELLQKHTFDAVLLNPPRTGVDPQLIQTLLNTRPHHLQYLSCMPATLARDLQALHQGGYTVAKIQAFDMFPQTTHVETLVTLTHE